MHEAPFTTKSSGGSGIQTTDILRLQTPSLHDHHQSTSETELQKSHYENNILSNEFKGVCVWW